MAGRTKGKLKSIHIDHRTTGFDELRWKALGERIDFFCKRWGKKRAHLIAELIETGIEQAEMQLKEEGAA